VNDSLRVRAYASWSRALVAAALAASRASLPVILLLVLLATDPPVTPPALFRLVAMLTVLPGAAAWLAARALTTQVEVRGDDFVLTRGRVKMEVPCASIAEVAPWVVPLPGPGVALRLRSGRRLPWALESADPRPLLLLLAERAGVAAARAALTHPTVVYAQARVRRGWLYLVAKFPLFALAPTAVFFNAHQHIAYGGTLGEYHLLGPASYLGTLATYWATMTIYLVLYASVLRAPAEEVALLTAWVAPSRMARVRRAVEIACNVLYFGGVPVLVALRFLPW
jgi:hypothetical protein